MKTKGLMVAVVFFTFAVHAQLSEKEIRDKVGQLFQLAEQYGDGYTIYTDGSGNVRDDLFEFKNMFLETFEERSPSVFWPYSKTEIKQIDGNNVALLLYSEHNNQKSPGYIQFTNEGKIKYCTKYKEHPIDVAAKAFNYLYEHYNIKDGNVHWSNSPKQKYYDNLCKSGIPTFDFSPDASSGDQRASLKKIREWIKENYETWDKGEPHLPIPKSMHKRILFLLSVN